MLVRGFLISVLLLWMLAAGTALAQQASCPGSLPLRLSIGDPAQVTPGASNRMRAEATTSAARIGEIPGGSVVLVLDGPVCADGYTWWQVDYDGLVGWTVEGSDSYWLEPRGALRATSPELASIALTNETSFDGVSFRFSDTVASAASGQIAAEEVWGAPIFDMPQRIEFTFSDYPSSVRPLEVAIYRVSEYERVKEESLEALRSLLDKRLAEAVVSPMVNAAVVLAVQPRYVEFENGVGVRSLMTWAQSVDWIASLHYVFVGLTNDGEHYIEVILPLAEMPWPSAAELTKFEVDYDQFAALYDEYINLHQAAFESAGADDFTPGLHALDAMIASLRIEETSLARSGEE